VRDVFTYNGQYTQALYTTLPQLIAESINNTRIRFNERVDDTFIWNHNINGTYTAKSRYSWLLSHSESNINPSAIVSWSWIWRLKIPEKFKVLVWLACHNVVPTLSLLHHRHIATSATCSRCGEEDESMLHCLRDCSFSKNIWLKLSFTNHDFFGEEYALNWIKINATSVRSSTFLAGFWWTWRHRNQMCLSHETWSLTRINLHIQNTTDLIKATFHTASVPYLNRMVCLNNNNFNCVVLNVDGSCLGTPIRVGYGGIIRNFAGFFIPGFSGFLTTTTDILMAELTAIHRGLLLAVETDIEEMVCYSDSMLSIKLRTEHAFTYHAHAILIQDIKDLLHTRNFSIHHYLREGNQCVDFLAKLGATSNEEFVTHVTPLSDLLPLIRTDAMGTYFPRA